MSGNASSPHALGLFCSGLPGGRLNPSRKKIRPKASSLMLVGRGNLNPFSKLLIYNINNDFNF